MFVCRVKSTLQCTLCIFKTRKFWIQRLLVLKLSKEKTRATVHTRHKHTHYAAILLQTIFHLTNVHIYYLDTFFLAVLIILHYYNYTKFVKGKFMSIFHILFHITIYIHYVYYFYHIIIRIFLITQYYHRYWKGNPFQYLWYYFHIEVQIIYYMYSI